MSDTENIVVPSIGRIVLVRGEPICATDPWREYPAIITRVVDQNFVDVAVFQGPSVPCFVPVQFHNNMVIRHDRIVWRWPPQVQAEKVVVPKVPPAAEVSTHLSRAETELHDLSTRFTALGNFLGSSGFGALPRVHRELLVDQHDAMQVYRSILMQRVQLLTAEA